jgi:RimJ/RimL family protein N-acetyltransferase
MNLVGKVVQLVPLTVDHVDALCEVGFDAEIWRWMPKGVRDRGAIQEWVEEALTAQGAGSAIPFATTLLETGKVIGSTRFMNIDNSHRRAEIGATWITPIWQRSRVNTEAKYLMLRYAFEEQQRRRVEFKTSSQNLKSRAAILRLGATEEGTFRKHMIQEDGSNRDTVYFSIIDDEWPTVKARLEMALGRDGLREG